MRTPPYPPFLGIAAPCGHGRCVRTATRRFLLPPSGTLGTGGRWHQRRLPSEMSEHFDLSRPTIRAENAKPHRSERSCIRIAGDDAELGRA
jgi:hypothetical protein